MTDVELPVTRLPRLDNLALPQPEASDNARYETISRPLRLAVRNGEPFTTPRNHHRRLLGSFADFVLAFTGDDDISFDFTIIPNHHHHPPPSHPGVARAAAPGSPTSDTQLELLAGMNASESEFGIVIAESGEASRPWDGHESRKPFLVIVDGTGCTVRLVAGRIPPRLVDPIVSALVLRLNPAGDVAESPSLSILNHPPIARPPDFESLLGLRTSAAKRQTHLLHGAFSARVKDQPDRPAIEFLSHTGRVVYSYEQVDLLSSALAQRLRSSLRARGYEAHRHIAVLLYPCPELYVAWLGVLKAGCTFCPIPVETPSELLLDLAEELEARVVLSSGRESSELDVVLAASPALHYIDLDIFLQQSHLPCPQGEQESVQTEPGDIAYIMYTSGSTGKPKGVQVTHIGAACMVAANIKAAPAAFRNHGGGKTRWFQMAAPTFDASVAEIFMTLSVGGTLCACDRHLSLTDPEAAITELGADSMMTTPSMASLLRPDKVPDLRHVWSIGEALNARVIENFASPGQPPTWDAPHNLINTYGPTEATVNCTIDQVAQGQRGSIIGPVVSTCSVVLLDPSGRSDKPVPIGFSGELAIGGPQVSAGYLKRPEQNAESFVDRPPFGRLYRTGDRARIVEGLDGALTLDFLGRISSGQIKIAGRRVELGEIEAAITGPSVAEAAVVYMPTSPGETGKTANSVGITNQVIAVVVPRDAIDAENLYSDCQSSAAQLLQPFMRPSKIYMMPELPRTVSDKVDRKALQRMCLSPRESGLTPLGPEKPETGQPELDAVGAISPDMSAVFELVARALTPFTALLSLGVDSLHAVQLLQRAREEGFSGLRFEDVQRVAKIRGRSLGPATTLAELGLDSIAATKLSSRLRAEGHDVSVPQILGCRCIGDLAALTSRIQGELADQWWEAADQFDQYWRPLAAQALKDAAGKFRLASTTPMQDGVLVESLREPSSYWGTFAWTLSPVADIGRLREAWGRAAVLHEILRTGFVSPASFDTSAPEAAARQSSSTFMQVIFEEASLPWVELSATGGLRAAVRQLNDELATKHHSNAFSAPPWQVAALTMGNERFMILTMHHSLYDGDMIRYLISDLKLVYDDLDYRSERCQVQEAISRLTLRHNSMVSLNFWTEQLKGFEDEPDADLEPAKAQPKELIVHRTTEVRASLSKSQLSQAATDFGVSSFNSLIRVAYGSMLAELFESERALFAEIRSERVLEARLADAMAPLVSICPVTFFMGGTPRQTVRAQAELASRTTEYGSIHAGQVRKLINRRADKTLYPAVYAFHPYASEELTTSLWQEMDDVLELSVDHPFALNVMETSDDGVRLSLAIDETIMTSAAQEMLTHELDALLSSMVLYPEASSLLHLTKYFPPALVSISEHVLLEEYRSPINPLYHVELLAEQHPEWKAVEVITEFRRDEIRTVYWTFRQLNHAANRVAHFIRRHSLQGRTIAMSLDRDLTSFAVILGILKSGNVYVPVDTSLPTERQNFILQDSDAAMFFTRNAECSIQPLQDELRLVTVGSSFLESLETMSRSNPIDQGIPELDAYFLYTSGSTGTPKGVRVSRSNLSCFMDAFSHFICTEAPATRRLGGSGKYLCLASRAFDPHIAEMFLAWRHGMCAVTGERLSLLDNLSRTLRELHVTHASFVPSLLDQTGLTPSDAPDLVYLTVGGEKMTPQTQRAWAFSERVNLVNAYGPTEVTIGCCAARLYPDSDTRNIGKPVGDTCAHVFIPGTDVHVKKGMAGELVLGGSLVANGYHKRPDAKGFCTVNGQRMYRTGDIVRMEPDGSILFLGRKDDQVKVRGQRLELGEVSQVVRSASVEPVNVATLLLRHPEMPRQSLVSFVAASGPALRGDAVFLRNRFAEVDGVLKKACQASLPAYMVPDFIVPVSCLPLTETAAKTDSKLLAKIFRSIPIGHLFESNGAKSNGVASPARELNAREKQIVTAITSVISQQSEATITPETSVFRLGVDSITAVNITFRLRRLGFDVSVAQLLRSQSIEQLVSSISTTQVCAQDKEDAIKLADDYLDALDDAVRKELAGLSSPIAQCIESVWPCLPLQEILVAHSLSRGPGSDAQYISHIMFQLSSGIQALRVRRAWEAVVREVAALRTCFHCRDRDIVQVVLQPEASHVSWSTISGKTSELEGNLHALRQSISDEMIASLHRIPPMRLTLASAEGSPEHQQPALLMLSMHHGLYDMESLGLIIADVEMAYAQGKSLSKPSIAPLMRHAVMQSRRDTQARKYWEAMFAGKSQEQSTQSGTLHLAEPRHARRVFKTRLGAIESLCAKTNFTPSGLIQGLFAYVLAQGTKDKDVTFGVVLSGRSIDVEGIHDIRAPCIATIPQRLCLTNGRHSLADVVRTVQTQLFHSMDYQYTSLRSISSWLGVSGSLFSSLFSFIRTPVSTSGAGSAEKALKYVEGHMSLEYPLAVECEANPGNDSLTLQARCSLSGPFQDPTDMLEKIEFLASALLQEQELTVNINKSSFGIANGTGHPKNGDDTWSPLEETIRDTITNFCGTNGDQIDKTTPFIKFGIDSITTIRFAKLLRERGVQVSGADAVRNPSIRALARHVKSSADACDNDHQRAARTSKRPEWSLEVLRGTVPPSVLSGFEYVYPLTPLQAGMVTATLTLSPKLYSYHHALSLPIDTDVLKLKEAWHALLEHHDILRTSFFAPQDKQNLWVGAVHREPILRWQEFETDMATQCLQTVVEEAVFQDPASFEKPPVGVAIIRGPSELLFVASLHHSTYDVVSINFVFHDLWSLYNDMAPPPRRPFHEAALAIWKQSQQSTDFWTNHLAGYRSVRIPLTDEEEARQTPNTSSLRVVDGAAGVEEWCTKAGTTAQSLVFLALGKAVCSVVGARDVVLGQVVAARVAIDEADEIAGPMLNTLPFRLCLSDTLASNLASLQGLQEFYDRSLDHQHGSLMDIQSIWRDDSATEQDLFDTLFVFQKEGEAAWNGRTPWKPYELPDMEEVQPLSHYRLQVEAVQKADGSLVVTASSKMAKKKLEDLLELIASCFHDIMASPERLAVAFPDSLAGLPLSPRKTFGEKAQDSFQQEAIDRFFAPLSTILADVTGSPAANIGPNTSIYSIGIDSIMAIRVASACRREGVNLATADIIRNTKVGRLCEAALVKSGVASETIRPEIGASQPLVTNADVEKALSRLGVHRDTVEEVLPLLPGQEYFLGLWLQSAKTNYEATWVLRARRRLDPRHLQRAWSILRQRFTTLRSCFVALGHDKALQVVLRADMDSTNLCVERVDNGSNLEETVRDRVKRAFRDPSSLYQPPARIRLIQGVVEKEDAILVTLHHATYDGWSMGLLIAELSTLCEDPESVMKPLPSFSRFVKETCASSQNADAEAFWRKTLGTCEPTLVGHVSCSDGEHLPPPNAGAAVPLQPPASHSIVLDCPDIGMGAVEAAARRAGVTPQSIIVAAFARTLCVVTGSRDAVFGYYTAGRFADFEDIEALAGPTVNMLPVVVPAHLTASPESGAALAAERLRSLQETLSARTAYEQSRLRDVLRWAGRETCSGLFNAHLNLLWNDEVLLASPAAQNALFRPWTLGAQSEFASREPILTPSAVDALDATFLATRALYVDIGPGPQGGLGIGASCEAAVQGVQELDRFLRLFRDHVGGLLACLST